MTELTLQDLYHERARYQWLIDWARYSENNLDKVTFYTRKRDEIQQLISLKIKKSEVQP